MECWFYLDALASFSVSYGRMAVLSGYSGEFVTYSWNVGFIWMVWQVGQFLMEGWCFYLGTLVSLSVSHDRLVVLSWYLDELVSFSWKVGGFIWVLW